MIFESILIKIYKIQFSVYCNRLPYNIPYLDSSITNYYSSIEGYLGAVSMIGLLKQFYNNKLVGS